MYEVFYNLKAEPFRLSPDHRFCYDHSGYAKARAYMAYAFMRAEGFVMITGRPGTGKTTLIGELVESLADENVTTANLVCTQLHADDLLKMVAYSFGVDSNIVEKGELIQRLQALLEKWHRENRRALLIVDEAQDLTTSAMEELRLLTNIQINGNPLLQIFLLGQPELRELILSPALEQVHQRIVAASHLQSLKCDETEAYIHHRLNTVGWEGNPALSKAIFPLIYKFSEGIPRRINLICSRLFLHGAVEQRSRIGVKDVRDVIAELQSESLAVGSVLSDFDFDVEDVYEDEESSTAEVEAEAEQETLAGSGVSIGDNLKKAVQLRAVGSDSGAGSQKKKPDVATTVSTSGRKQKKRSRVARKPRPKKKAQSKLRSKPGPKPERKPNLELPPERPIEREPRREFPPGPTVGQPLNNESVSGSSVENPFASSAGAGFPVFLIFLISLFLVGYAIH